MTVGTARQGRPNGPRRAQKGPGLPSLEERQPGRRGKGVSPALAADSITGRAARLAERRETDIRRRSERRRQGLRLAAALQLSERPEERAKAKAVGECAAYVRWAVRPCACPVPARKLIAWETCKDRLCGTCAAQRARRLAAGVEAAVAAAPGGRLVFLTLTVRSEPEISGDTVSQMWRWFRQLRRTSLWSGVAASAASLEFTVGPQGWHPHIHVLASVAPGAWLPEQREWSERWAEINGGSPVVDIRPVRGDVASAAREVAKYAAKGSSLKTPGDLLALHRAIFGRRLWLTTGAWRGVSEQEPAAEPFADHEDGTGTCPDCGVTAAPITAIWVWNWLTGCYNEHQERRPPGDPRALWGETPDPGGGPRTQPLPRLTDQQRLDLMAQIRYDRDRDEEREERRFKP